MLLRRYTVEGSGVDEWDGSLLLSSDLASLDGPCGGAAVAFPLGGGGEGVRGP